MKILLVEDNNILAKGLIYSLEQKQYNVVHKLNIQETINYLIYNRPSLIILDISLPDGNGFDLYTQKIKPQKIPTIFLTAKDDEDDIVKGLELGADDYITKPFSTRELIARINKILLKENKNYIVKVKDIEFDMDKMVITKNSKEIKLTSLELKILNLLFVNDNTVTVYLKRIREKIGSDIIKTIKGIGYRVDKE